MPRTILHLDLDAFYCAVEEQLNPDLRGKPFAVGGNPDERGVVASCSYAARRFGVRSAMPMSQAVRLCPPLLIVHHHFDAYHAASSRVMDVLHNLTPIVEQISIDEAFLDVTLLREDGAVVAKRLQTSIRDGLGLPCSLGVATNKLVAKIATNMGKARVGRDAPPNAIEVVPHGREAAFLAPLPINEMWGVGPKTASKLHKLGIETIGDLAEWPQSDLTHRFGKNGTDLSQRARGIDDSPVEVESETKSVSKEVTFSRDISDADMLKRTLRQLSDEVGRRLRQDGLNGTTIKLKLRWTDFTTLTRQVTLPQPTQHDKDIYTAILQLFDKTWMPGEPVRLLGVGVSNFEANTLQLGLWDATTKEEAGRLENSLDTLRDRFGEKIVRRGSDLLHKRRE